MPDYRDWGYNQFMEKNPYLETTRYSSLQTKGLIPIGAISFDKASGGTLVIGGKDNAGGVISVRDDNATERILINSSGITISDGKITIVDNEGTTVIDGFGLVSSGSFAFDSVTGAGTQTTSSTTYVALSGISLSFTLTRSAQVVIFLNANGYIQGQWDDGTARTAKVSIFIDGAAAINDNMDLSGFRFGDPSSIIQGQTGSMHTVQTLSAGTHTIDARFGTSNASYDAGIFRDFTRLSYLVLGK